MISSTADPLTSVFAEPNENSEVLGKLEARAPVDILNQTTLEVWFLIPGENGNQTVEGWAPSRYIRVLGDETRGRIDQGNISQFTTRFLQRMFSDRFFMPALGMTILLTVLIIPVQFVLAIIMALVIQAELKGYRLFPIHLFDCPRRFRSRGGHSLVFDFHSIRVSQLDPAKLGPDPPTAHLPFGKYALLDCDCHLAGGGLAGHVHCDGDRRRWNAGYFSRGA